jgi:hypothetical protein
MYDIITQTSAKFDFVMKINYRKTANVRNKSKTLETFSIVIQSYN